MGVRLIAMRHAVGAAAVAVLTSLPVHTATAQETVDPVPDRRIVTAIGQDFYGGDIGSIFDTTFKACRDACYGNPACQALTYNTRAEACFLKSGVERVDAFDGAISSRMIETSDATRQKAAARRAEIGFLPDALIAQAAKLAGSLGGRVAANGQSVDALHSAAAASEAAGDLENAAQHLSAAVSVADRADSWRDLARVWGSIRSENSQERRRLQRDSLSAALNAYLRSEGAASRASSLLTVARALEPRGRGRDMIPTLRLAQSVAPRDEAAKLLDDAEEKYGFRVVGHSVESDAASPRICVDFSEPLSDGGIDYAPYVAVEGETKIAVEAQGNQLCAEGFRHGLRYSMAVRSGLKSGAGETLRKTATVEAYVRDRSPSVRFVGRAYVLPKSSTASIPVVTVNLDSVEIEIHRIGERNLLNAMQTNLFDEAINRYREDSLAGEFGSAVWKGTAEVSGEVNGDTTTALPIGDAIETFEPGVYAMTARVPGEESTWERAATQWFIVTDLGLASMSASDGVHGFVRALSSAEAVADAKVRLIARNNEILGEASSDADGYVRFAPGLTRGTGGDAPALLTVERDGDFAFLDLSKPGFDLSDRGVAGRPVPGPVDVFASTERGVYRPGEVVHLTALTRDGAANAIADLPLTAVVSRPDGVEYRRTVLNDQGAGGRSWSVRLGTGALRGTWSLKLYTDPKAKPVRQITFLVEDFVPEKLAFDLTLPDEPVNPAAAPIVDLDVRYLYGAPGADLPVEGEVRLTSTATLHGYPGFRFGLADEETTRLSTRIDGGRTDAQGRARVPLTLPDGDAGTRPLEMTAIVQVRESSGRPVERSLTRPVLPGGLRLGIKPLFEDQAEEGSNAGFELIAVGADGSRVAAPEIGWSLSRIDRTWVWYELDGRWRYEPITRREKIANGIMALSADSSNRVEAPVAWGEYELKLATLQGEQTASSYKFTAGWYTGGAGTETPDILEVGLDKPAYRIGETAKLRLKPRDAGKVLIAVVDNRVIDLKTVDVSAGETTVDLPVTAEWGPGAYVTSTLIRPSDATQSPARALGLAWAEVDPEDRVLDLSFDTPDQLAPRGPLPVAVRIANLKPGSKAQVTLAAVDVGILNLTSFKSPAPDKYYFSQRRLGTEMRDLYGKLIDGNLGTLGRLRSGGDAEAQRLKAAPPVEELVAYFSGVLEVAPDGSAEAQFELPDFNGTVRLMAVAWTDSAVGHAEKDVLVRDPIVVSAATPRFLAPGDQSRILLDLAHASGPSGDVSIRVSGDGAVSVPGDLSTISVPDGAIRQISLPMTAAEIGNSKIRVETTTPDGKTLAKNLLLPVRMNDPEIARRSRLTLSENGTLKIDRATFDGMRAGTARATLAVGPLAVFDAPGLLTALDRYPYGCTEQTTSRALPLLYLSEVSDALGLTAAADLETRISEAIGKVLRNQSRRGSYGLWRPGRGDLWLDAYVTDFLSRAKARGHTVQDTAFRAALDNLQSQISYSGDFTEGGEDVAYALMVLAREGAASIGDLRYYADAKADAFATPMAKAQLGAALASYGEQRRADLMFRAASAQAKADTPDGRGWRYDYGSHLRDGAAVLALAAEAGSEVASDRALLRSVADRAGAETWTSTQEKVWMLMATAASLDRTVQNLTVDGAPLQTPVVSVDDRSASSGQTIEIANAGTAIDAALTVFGVPEAAQPAGGKGYRIERAYYTLEGDAVGVETIARNTRLAVVLNVSSERTEQGRLMIDDPLPAGFEIENPNLLKSGSVRGLEWVDALEEVEMAEFRTDRFRAAVNASGGQFRLAYIVRAVSPGAFHHPAATVEDMYRPEFRAWTDSGRVEILPGTP
ncbi:MAG: alpha-2-macroglobulin family protein [Pseudomonadota bacterium]